MVCMCGVMCRQAAVSSQLFAAEPDVAGGGGVVRAGVRRGTAATFPTRGLRDRWHAQVMPLWNHYYIQWDFDYRHIVGLKIHRIQ